MTTPARSPLEHADFLPVYREVADLVYRHWSPEMQIGMARHNWGWGPESFDFREYLDRSSIRFYKAYRAAAGHGTAGVTPKVCDVGGLWGVLPLLLRRLGFEAVMTEALQYYDDTFDGLFGALRGEGVEIIDYDPFTDAPPAHRFDLVTVMAVIEHYPHSLRQFMDNVTAMLNPGAGLYLEVPNIAYWYKRVAMMLSGKTPLAPIEHIWDSAVPFTGHHHEYTMAELEFIAQKMGLTVEARDYYNYSIDPASRRQCLRHPLRHGLPELAFRRWPESRECLAVLCRRRVDRS